MIEALDRLLEGERGKSFGAAQAAVWAAGRLVHASAHGGHGRVRADENTLFDISSLTKVVATTTLAYRMISSGALALDDRVGRFFPDAAAEAVTIRELLAHRSGLPAWAPLFTADEGVFPRLLSIPPEAGSRGERIYSDLGFIFLGAILEKVGGGGLDRLFHEEVARPLDLVRTGFRPLPARVPIEGERLAIAPTGTRRPRPPAPGQEGMYEAGAKVEDAGEVDDDNAWALGGVAGHAGLFSTAEEVVRWAEAIHAEREGAGRIGRADLLADFFGPAGGEALGFDRPSGELSSAGRILGQAGPLGAVGHLGFTGCSVWLDLDRRWSIALLTNRVHPDRKNEAIRTLRPRFHDEAAHHLRDMDS